MRTFIFGFGVLLLGLIAYASAGTPHACDRSTLDLLKFFPCTERTPSHD